MTEQNEMLILLKELVDKVKNLERAVYDKDNLLMKSGYVVHDTRTPHTNVQSGITGDSVANMEWEDIHKMVEGLQ